MNREEALKLFYLVIGREIQQARLESYKTNLKEMADYVEENLK